MHEPGCAAGEEVFTFQNEHPGLAMFQKEASQRWEKNTCTVPFAASAQPPTITGLGPPKKLYVIPQLLLLQLAPT